MSNKEMNSNKQKKDWEKEWRKLWARSFDSEKDALKAEEFISSLLSETEKELDELKTDIVNLTVENTRLEIKLDETEKQAYENGCEDERKIWSEKEVVG